MAADRQHFLLQKEDRTNSSAHWALGYNEFPTANLLSDPHSPLPLYHCAFDLHSELLRSNTANMFVSVVDTACVFQEGSLCFSVLFGCESANADAYH